MAKQLERFFAEGLEQRWARHRELAAYVREWMSGRGFDFFVDEPYRSVTLTCIANNRGIDLKKLKGELGECGYAFDDGYGKLKGETFRIAHMGDLSLDGLKEFIGVIDKLTPGA
jgi:aspartate aminotransferase-like enzyme